MLVTSLAESRLRIQELLRDIVSRPDVKGDLAAELEQIFGVLRNYSYFVDYQRRELAELCAEMEQL